MSSQKCQMEENLNLLGYAATTSTLVDAKSEMIAQIVFLLSKYHDKKFSLSPTTSAVGSATAPKKQTKTTIQRTFIAHFIKLFEDFKRQGLLPLDCQLRKSYFEECRGDRYEYTMLCLSNTVLIRVLDRDYGVKVEPFKVFTKKCEEADLYEIGLQRQVVRLGDEFVQSSIANVQFERESRDFSNRVQQVFASIKEDELCTQPLDLSYKENLAETKKRCKDMSSFMTKHAKNMTLTERFVRNETNKSILCLKSPLSVPDDILPVVNEIEPKLALYDGATLNLGEVSRIYKCVLERLVENANNLDNGFLVGMHDSIIQSTADLLCKEESKRCEAGKLKIKVKLLESEIQNLQHIAWELVKSKPEDEACVLLSRKFALLSSSRNIVDDNLYDQLIAPFMKESGIAVQAVASSVLPEAIKQNDLTLSNKENSDISMTSLKAASRLPLRPLKKVGFHSKKGVLDASSDQVVQEMTKEVQHGTGTPRRLANSRQLEMMRGKGQGKPVIKAKHDSVKLAKRNQNYSLSDKAFETVSEIPRTPLKNFKEVTTRAIPKTLAKASKSRAQTPLKVSSGLARCSAISLEKPNAYFVLDSPNMRNEFDITDSGQKTFALDKLHEDAYDGTSAISDADSSEPLVCDMDFKSGGEFSLDMEFLRQLDASS